MGDEEEDSSLRVLDDAVRMENGALELRQKKVIKHYKNTINCKYN